MSRYIVAFASLAVLLYTQGAVGAPDAPEKCPGPKVFQKISACCEPPKVIKKEAFGACRPDKKPMNSTGGEPPKRSPYQAMCLFECVFKSQNMVSEASGAINYSVLSASFLKAVNSTWAARTRTAITTCTKVTAQIDANKIPASSSGEKTCNPKPALFMTCFEQNMLVLCASGKSSKCSASDVEQLRKALPINILLKPDSA